MYNTRIVIQIIFIVVINIIFLYDTLFIYEICDSYYSYGVYSCSFYYYGGACSFYLQQKLPFQD